MGNPVIPADREVIRDCLWCKKPFRANTWKQRHCSDSCCTLRSSFNYRKRFGTDPAGMLQKRLRALGLCQDCGNPATGHVYCGECKKKYYAYYAKWEERILQKLFEVYGDHCAHCNEDHREFLALDHVQGGGNQHRKVVGSDVRKWAYKNGCPKGMFQFLCHNCNFKKSNVYKPESALTNPQIADRRNRIEGLTHYAGGVLGCTCCDVTDPQLLTLEHCIPGEGRKHRELKMGAVAILRDLQKRGYPPGYSCLCFNCNLSRGFYRYCPHEKERLVVPVSLARV